MTLQPATTHTCQKINWAYETVSAIVHSLKHDTPASLRGTRTSPLILYRIWQSCVLSHATPTLIYLLNPTQVQQVQSALINRVNVFSMAKVGRQEGSCPMDCRLETRDETIEGPRSSVLSLYSMIYVARRPRIVAPARSII